MIRSRTLALAAAAALALAGAASAQAVANPSAPSQETYAALGDSFAAGTGNPPLSATDPSGRSAAAYPVLLAGGVDNVTFLAATGATTTDAFTQQVPHIPASATQITLTLGGNDLGVGTVATTCLQDPAQCEAAVTEAAAKVPELGTNLGAVVGQIKARVPGAEVYVTGYPLLFQPTQGCAGISPEALPALGAADQATVNLNTVIAAAAAAGGGTYVDVTAPFTGHGLCQGADSWIFGADQPVPFHPNAAGQQAYADAVAATAFVSAGEQGPAPSASPSQAHPGGSHEKPAKDPVKSQNPEAGYSKHGQGGLAKTGH